MSNSEMSAERREVGSESSSGDDNRDELRSILDTIASQLEDADRRHMAALSEMQSRISDMGREADSLRARIPNQFAPAFERIEAGIDELAHRLADPAPQKAQGSRADGKASSTARSRSSDARDPWDQQSADALAQVYEASGFPPGAEGTGSEATGSSNIDEAWLESRFAEIARGIEYSLANVKPENGIAELGQRLDQFERQFAKLFAGVATHDDLSTVRLIEAHMEEVVNHLEKTNDQLERLGTLEKQIASVAKAVEEIQASSMQATKSADIEAVARVVADETAQRFTSKSVDESNAAAAELRPLIEQLMTEQRQGGEQTAALLDTMQQAMVRLLDRVEAIDFTPPPPRIVETGLTERSSGGLGIFGDDTIRGYDPTIGDSHDVLGEPFARVTPSSVPSAPPLSTGYASMLSAGELAEASEKLRQEFVADARRAKTHLASQAEDIDVGLPPSFPTLKPAEAIASPPGSRPIRPSKQTKKKNASGPSAPSPRLIFVAVLVLIALTGLWYLFGFENAPDAVSASQGTTSQSKTSSGGAGEGSTKAQTPSAPAGDNVAPTPPDANGPRGDLAPEGQPNATPTDDDTQPRTALPMLGVAVDLNRPTTPAELMQARRHQAMANLSGQLGNAAARPDETGSLPTSMIPSEAETEGMPQQQQSSQSSQSAVKSRPLDMPTAMIGPLSLRLAAANGDASAQFEVGARFAEGSGVKQNFVEAAKWYQMSADQGFAQAQYRLGTLYERGLGLKPDRGQAGDWYLRAAKQGNIKAMHNLAVLAANQMDRSPDYMTAALWFTEAAKRGLPDSQFNLAILYENGLGVPRDLKQAFLWLSLAAQGGDDDAIRRRDILRGKLTAQELTEAQKMINSWRLTPSDRSINDALAAGGLWKKNL